MAKGNLNPAEAYRKSQKKKEQKKNKTERAKKRDWAVIKKDTWELQDEIEELEGTHNATPAQRARIQELKSELQFIINKKEEYLKDHPDQRRFVFRPRRKEGDKPPEEIVLPKRNYFKKNGLPKHPERSIYYDPVMNPFGMPPPGMPYQERPLKDDEVDSQPSSEDEDEIAMPSGPPPPPEGEEFVTSDDEIALPDGPPPGEEPPLLPSIHGSIPPPPFIPPVPVYPPRPALTNSQPVMKRQANFAAATISADPELRDFKKEATAFVPSSLKRKRPTAPANSEASQLNAAPTLATSNEDQAAESLNPTRPDLLSTLRNKFGTIPDSIQKKQRLDS